MYIRVYINIYFGVVCVNRKGLVFGVWVLNKLRKMFAHSHEETDKEKDLIVPNDQLSTHFK